MTNDENFFSKQTPSSRIKANIVAEYFPQYCRILLKRPQNEIRYLDLFAGPGKYDDGNHSTPLLIAKACSEDANLASKVRLLFNDNKHIEKLRANFQEEFPPGTFKYEPTFGNKTVGEDKDIQDYLEKSRSKPNPFPTLLFFDPFGYKGINTLVLSKFLGNWGNEIFLFVNIKRIHAAIENEKFNDLMNDLFPTTINDLRHDRRYSAVSVYERLNLIMDNLSNEFKKAVKGSLYSCAFKFQEEDSTATSHYVIHFTKHEKGYELVKQVYYDYDNIGANLEKDGVYTFDAKRINQSPNSMLNFGDANTEALSSMLSEEFGGQQITAKALFEQHNPKTRYCRSHYATTLRDMVAKGAVNARFTDSKNHRVSVLLTDECILNFM
jgi:three-Cys-motif partner protein